MEILNLDDLVCETVWSVTRIHNVEDDTEWRDSGDENTYTAHAMDSAYFRCSLYITKIDKTPANKDSEVPESESRPESRRLVVAKADIKNIDEDKTYIYHKDGFDVYLTKNR